LKAEQAIRGQAAQRLAARGNSLWSGKPRSTPPAAANRARILTVLPRNSGLQRRDLVVDLGSVVEVVLVLAGSREEELDAVAAHAVVAGVEGRATDGADFAVLVGAARDPELDLHDVPWVAPHNRVVGVVPEVVLYRHDDRATTILLADDSRYRVGFEVDFAVALGKAAFPREGARMKAPWGNPVNGRYLRTGRGSAGRADHAQRRQYQQSRQGQNYESAVPCDVDAHHVGARLYPSSRSGIHVDLRHPVRFVPKLPVRGSQSWVASETSPFGSRRGWAAEDSVIYDCMNHPD